MHDSPMSREMKKINGTRKTMKIKISAAPVDREKNSSELSAAEFFNLFELRTPLIFFISRDVGKSCMGPTLYLWGIVTVGV